jgi:hypothetical protein
MVFGAPIAAPMIIGTGKGIAFRIRTDVPVVAYEMNPFGGGSAAITGASLLLPTSAWDTNYVANTASPKTASGPSINVIAAEDGTQVTLLKRFAIFQLRFSRFSSLFCACRCRKTAAHFCATCFRTPLRDPEIPRFGIPKSAALREAPTEKNMQ